MAKKKDKKVTAKRGTDSQEQKKQSRNVESKGGVSVQVVSRPPMSEIESPEEFRPVSISQAMMEYAKPLLEFAKSRDHNELNEILQISMSLWNFTTMGSPALKRQTVEAMAGKFEMDLETAEGLFDKMIERKDYLFPKAVQPNFPPTVMLMRKEISHVIAVFNYKALNYLREVIPPDERDREAIRKIIQMDQYIIGGAEYDDWEDFYFSMEEEVQNRYEKWLADKGLTEYEEAFPAIIETYLNFVYMYDHDHLTTLKSIRPRYLEEFFTDYVLRKLIAEPHEYTIIPPAVRFFYAFLHEKGYIDDPEKIIRVLDKMEPGYIKILRKQFG